MVGERSFWTFPSAKDLGEPTEEFSAPPCVKTLKKGTLALGVEAPLLAVTL